MKKLGSFDDRWKLMRRAMASPELRAAVLTSSEEQVHKLVAQHLDVREHELPREAIQWAIEVSGRKLPLDGDSVPDSAKETRRLSRFTIALSGALGGEEPPTPKPSSRGAWFSGAPSEITRAELLAYLESALPEDARTGPHDEGLRKQGYEPLLTRLRYESPLRFTLTAKGVHGLAYRIREVNAALFGPVTFALADGIRGLVERPLDQLPRVGEAPKGTTSKMFGQAPESLVTLGLDLESQWVMSGSAPYRPHYGPNGAYFLNRAVVGEYGPELATAIVEANRIAFSLVEEMAASLGSDAHKAVIGRLTTQKEAVPLLQEGIASIGHALALVLAKKPEGMTLDEALNKIGSQGLIAQLAIHAPFGQLAPMNGQGLVPKEPITENERGQLLIPRSLRKALETASANTHLPSMEHAVSAEFPTQTKMGCPVASRIPKQGSDQRASPLHVLAADYIELVRKILREKPA